MTFTIKRIQYFYTTVKDQPGEAYKLLNMLSGMGVNQLAFSAVPVGPNSTQLAIFPEDPKKLSHEAKLAGMFLDGPHHFGLIRRQDGESNPFFCHQSQGLGIHSGFSQPHPFRRPAKTVFEIGQSPPDLGPFVPARRQRHDDVIVDLSQGIAVALVAVHTLTVRIDNLSVNPWMGLL